MILYFIFSPLLLSPQVSAVSPPPTDHTGTNFSLTRHSNLEFSCSFVVMTMHNLNHILDLCLLLLMIFRLLGQSILLFTATDIIKQSPCTSASIIFFSSLLTKLLTKLRTSRSFNFSSSSHALVTAYVSLQSQIHVLACCWHCSFACCWLCSCLTGSWVPSPGCFFFKITTQTFTIDCNTKSLSSTVRHNS